MIFTSQNFVRALAALAVISLATSPTDGGEESRQDGKLPRITPRDHMRALSADRPDATESTQTVDAGHAQLETEIASYLRDRSLGNEETLAFGATNLKLGVRHDLDIGIVFAPVIRKEMTEAGIRTVDRGFSNLEVRAKWNLWGNDGDTPTALALLPFVVIPVGGASLDGDDLAGGLIVPFAWEGIGGWSLGTQLGVEVGRNSLDDGTTVTISHTVVVGRELAPRLSGFLEFASVWPTERGQDWNATVNTGLVLGIHEDLQLDVGVAVGVNRASPDFALFAGVTVRF